MSKSFLDTLGRTKDAFKLQPDERAAQQKLGQIETGREQMGKLWMHKNTPEQKQLQAKVPDLLQRFRRAAAAICQNKDD